MKRPETCGMSGMTGKEHKLHDWMHYVVGGGTLGSMSALSWETPSSAREATGSQSPHSSDEAP